MNRQYETVCIVRTDAGDETIKGVVQKARAAVEGLGGRIDRLDEWGRRKLSYPINKKSEGYYFIVNYNSSPEASKELERVLKYNEDVIRYQTIRLEKAPEAAPAAPAPAAAPAGTQTPANEADTGRQA